MKQKKKKKNKKILLQIGLTIILIFFVLTLIGGTLIYHGSKSLFLDAKSEMIDRDLNRIRAGIREITMLSWLLDYCEEHTEEVKQPMTDEESLLYESFVTDLQQLAQTKGDPIYYWEESAYKILDKSSDKTRLAVAKNLYLNMAMGLSVEKLQFEYDDLYMMDIREEHRGFIFCRGDNNVLTSTDSLGEVWDYRLEDHPAAQEILSQDRIEEDYTIYEESHNVSDNKSFCYIGYAPVVIDGEVRAVICLSYDWTKFQSTLSFYLAFFTFLGIVLILVAVGLLILFLYHAAIKPLRLIQKSVMRYMDSKDSEAVVREMAQIKQRNEFGALADDIAALSLEIDRYTKENIRLVSEQERVSAELELAAKIQSDMLSKNFPSKAAYELFASMTPAKEVGGDFYDFFELDHDELCLVIADVSGKGVPAALFMMMTMILIRHYAREGLSPSQVLQKANESICENNRDDMFVTVWLGKLDLKTGRLTASNAGHEKPILKSPGQPFTVMDDPHGFVIGAMEGLRFKEYEINLEKGSKLFLYSDGLPEATDKHNKMFGIDNILLSLNKDVDRSCEQMLTDVKKDVDRFVGEAPQFDDLTMMCLTYPEDEKAPDTSDPAE